MKLLLVSLACFGLVACKDGSTGSAGPAGKDGKDATEIADGAMPLSKLSVAAAAEGSVLAVEGGKVVAKAMASSDAKILYKNSSGQVVATRGVSDPVFRLASGIYVNRLSEAPNNPLRAQAIGTTAGGTFSLTVVYSGAGCTGEARFANGDSYMDYNTEVLGMISSVGHGANGTYLLPDLDTGKITTPFNALSHMQDETCTDGTGAVMTQTWRTIPLPGGSPLVGLDVVRADYE